MIHHRFHQEWTRPTPNERVSVDMDCIKWAYLSLQYCDLSQAVGNAHHACDGSVELLTEETSVSLWQYVKRAQAQIEDDAHEHEVEHCSGRRH